MDKARLKRLIGSLRPDRIRTNVQLSHEKSALKSLGWYRSLDEKMCVDREGRPLPWFTYSSIYFLEDRVPSDASVFEFGMGNSTLWWSERVKTIACVEGDHDWFSKITPKLPQSATAFHYPNGSVGYINAATKLSEPIDILVLDGRERVACCKASIDLLASEGTVIWDNADRSRYAEGYDLLNDRGFKRLDFFGMGPLSNIPWLTTVFYRPANNLGL